MKKYVNKRVLTVFLVLLLTLVFVIQATPLNGLAYSETNQGSSTIKVSRQLSEVANGLSDDDYIPVSVWIKDVDIDNTQSGNKTNNSGQKIYTNSDLTPQYSRVTRKVAYATYAEYNKEFYEEVQDKAQAVHISNYTPNMMLNVKKKDLAELTENKQVESVDVVKEGQKVDETVNSIPNISANYTKNLGLTGKGVSIGILEGSPGEHADTVKKIITELAPNANVTVKYGVSIQKDKLMIEEFINEGVNIINMSAGYLQNGTGVYTDFARYIDTIVKKYNITFVKSSGNVKAYNSKITEPGMAYNSIIVGATDDKDTESWTDDTFWSSSAYQHESSGASKPDITAPGVGIYGSESGTSYSAPHVTGVIAQLMELNSELKTLPGAIKSILATGTSHRTADDYGRDLYSPYYSDKEGAGVIDAKGSYNIIKNSSFKYATISSSQFPYSGTFNVANANKSVRVSLSWLNQEKLSDLELKIYGPNNNLVGYSLSTSNNLELVEFNPRSATGTYKFVIEGSSLENSQEDVCVSWKQAD